MAAFRNYQVRGERIECTIDEVAEKIADVAHDLTCTGDPGSVLQLADEIMHLAADLKFTAECMQQEKKRGK